MNHIKHRHKVYRSNFILPLIFPQRISLLQMHLGQGTMRGKRLRIKAFWFPKRMMPHMGFPVRLQLPSTCWVSPISFTSASCQVAPEQLTGSCLITCPIRVTSLQSAIPRRLHGAEAHLKSTPQHSDIIPGYRTRNDVAASHTTLGLNQNSIVKPLSFTEILECLAMQWHHSLL